MPPRPQFTIDETDSGSTVSSGTLVSRNITVGGHRTSARLEPDMWDALSEICRRERMDKHTLCTLISRRKHPETSLTAAIRVFIMAYFRAAATEEGHSLAGHGLGDPFGDGKTAPPTEDERMSVMRKTKRVGDPLHPLERRTGVKG